MCWGMGFFGELGDGSLSKVHDTPVVVCQVYDDVAEECTESLSGVISLDTGLSSTCALMEAGCVRCWGISCGLPIANELRQCRIPEDVLGLEAKPTPAPTILTPKLTITPTPTMTPDVLLGDVNCDGTVDATDAAAVLQFDAKLVSALRCFENADVNEDGAVNALDAMFILQHVAGLKESL